MPDARLFESPLERCLCVLADVTGALDMSALQISTNLLYTFGLDVHWRTVDAVLGENKKCVARSKRGGRWYYKILHEGRLRVSTPTENTLLIDPAKGVQNVTTLHDLLMTLSGTVRVCDPYLDATTVEHLDSCPGNVRLLTHNVSDSGRLRQSINAFDRPGRTVSIKRVPKADLHDRYFIDDKGMIILGTSLNGFGKKQCFMIRTGQDIRAVVLKTFDEKWKLASDWPPP
jgi:hypothetical protein